MTNDIEIIKNLLQRENAVDDSEDEFLEATQKFSHILQSYSNESDYEVRKYYEEVNAFANSDETQKRKILYYCLDFFDPTAKRKTIAKNGEEVELNSFLHEDDLCKLYQFIKRHESDSSFGETVYRVMDEHNMSAPQVYKAALLRRQDFSRATDPKCKNVSQHLAWQIIIGLRCNIEEADEILFSAGYIRRNTKFDLIMEYFIKHQNYDIMAINDVLYGLKQKVFSCYKPVKENDNY